MQFIYTIAFFLFLQNKEKEKEATFAKANNGKVSKRNAKVEEELKKDEAKNKDEPMDVVDPSSEGKNHGEDSVSEAPDDKLKLLPHDCKRGEPEELETKFGSNKTTENDSKEVVIVEVVERGEGDEVTTLSEEHGNEIVSRSSGRFRSTPKVLPSIASQRDSSFMPEWTTERNVMLSPVKIHTEAGLKSEGKIPQPEKISTNLIKLQYTSNYKLLCRLVDTMAYRQHNKDILGKNQMSPETDGPFKPLKPGFNQKIFKEQKIENQSVKSDSLSYFCKTSVGNPGNCVVSRCSPYSPRMELQSNSVAPQVNREDMTGKRVLPPILEKTTNSVRHDINRYLRSVSPVDPLLKRLSHYEKVNKVSWKSAFASLKSLKSL